MSIQIKYELLERAYPDMLSRIGELIQKGKISKRFTKVSFTESELRQLEKAKELCELKIVELWDKRETTEFKALCAVYFDIAVQLNIDTDNEYFIYEHIKLIAFGYLGEHWHFVKQYLKTISNNIEKIDDGKVWNQRLLTVSFKVLTVLVRKDNWKDIDKAVQLINQLRKEQDKFERTFLTQIEENGRLYGAAEIVSLYHFARSVEILGQYLIEGKPFEPETKILYHVNLSKDFANKSGNISLALLYQFFEALSVKIIRNTIWYTTSGINQWVTKFNKFLSKKDSNGVFELLYPQRESIRVGQLLNPAHKAIVVNLPTSSGKTMIAEYRILQALNDFKHRGGWVAYLVPTKALVNQIFIQLNMDLNPLGLIVEKASGVVDIDGFEQHLIEEHGNRTAFDVLVTTYEKMNLLVRQGLGTTTERPLVLTVVDEAHNIEETKRGLILEFLLSTIKNDCEEANFLLMTPDISNSSELVNWLAGDRGKVINLELHWWQPNERIVGAIQVSGRGRTFDFHLKTLHTEKGTYEIGDDIPLIHVEKSDKTKSQVSNSKVKIVSYLSSEILNLNSPIIVLAADVSETYTIAENLYNTSNVNFEFDEDIDLLIKFVKSELGNTFPLAKFLKRRIGIHSSALPDEIRFLVEDLMLKGKLQALVATTTIAQGINFPVSAIIMGSYAYKSKEGTYNMPVRDFWNLAGRVGRTGQENMGWVGLAIRNETDLHKVVKYVKDSSEEVQSQLIGAINSVLQYAEEDFAKWLFIDERWSAILQYISHLRKQTQQQKTFLSQLEQKLQGTLGYKQLPQDKKDFLRSKIRSYASKLTLHDAEKADETGFSTVSIEKMKLGLYAFRLKSEDWEKNQLFSEHNQNMQKLIGIMLNTYEIRKSIEELNTGGQPLDRSSIARMIIDWVNGRDIAFIATKIYPKDTPNYAIQKTTKALYKIIANAATWGIAALQKMPNSGIDWKNLSEIEKKRMANLPAYLHYGVNTDEGVLMRKNNVPRSIANRLGSLYSSSVEGEIFSQPSTAVTKWLNQLNTEDWHKIRPLNSKLSGQDYKKIWMKLIGLK